MIFRTVIQDCLRLNWAVPEEALEAPPEPLAYDVCKTAGGAYVFVSALLFRQSSLGSGVHLPGAFHPQCQFQVCALDAEGMECYWVFATLLPAWLAAGVRWAAGREARGARLDYPSAGEPGYEGESWRWSVRREHRLEAVARSGSAAGGGPSLGSFKETLAYFRRQRSEYVQVRGKWHRLQVDRADTEAMPVAATIEEQGLLEAHLREGLELPALHSCWLVPTMNAAFDYGADRERSALPEAPAPL